MIDVNTKEDLTRRYLSACDLRQPVRHPAIVEHLRDWQQAIGYDAPIQHLYLDALAARTAGAAGDALAARAALAAGDALAAGAARAARPVLYWSAWDLSFYSVTVIGCTPDLVDQWLPLLSAFEAGCWVIMPREDCLYYITIPAVKTEVIARQSRLHSPDSPAFSLDNITLYYWYGVEVPEQVIMRPETLTVADIDNEANAEVRRVMLERFGIVRYLRESEAQLVDDKPRFGKLYCKSLGDDFERALWAAYVVCPSTGREYWIPVDGTCYNGDAGHDIQAAIASTWRKKDGTLLFDDYREYDPVFES